MPVQAAQQRAKYTYQDYLGFPDDTRCEIIDGEMFDMTPSPTAKHQLVAGRLYRIIGNHLEHAGHPCQVFIAPLDVVLAHDQVVQPDVFVVCDREKIKQYIFGAPDVVFEVASASTALKDRREKMRLYERFGVKEYFIIDPQAEFLEKYVLHDGRYGERIGIYGKEDQLTVNTIGLELTPKDLFE